MPPFTRLPYNLGDWEASVARIRAELAALQNDRTPIEACDLDLRFRAEDWARERLHRAEMEMISAKHRSRFVITNWDGTEDPCWVLGFKDGVATVRFQDNQVQTMDEVFFWKNAR